MASSRRTGTNESKWSTPGGGGSWSAGANTFGTAGAGRDYTALSLWETDTDVDIVTATVSPVLVCYDDASSYAVTISWAGATTSSSYFRILRADTSSRHGGVPGAGVKFTATSGVINLNEQYATVQDVEVLMTGNSALNRMGIYFYDVANIVVVGALVKATNSGAGLATGIDQIDLANTAARVVNTIVYACDDRGIASRYNAQLIANCTVVGSGTGLYVQTNYDGPTIKNVIAYNNATADYGSGAVAWAGTHNLSKDATAPAVGTYYRSKTLTFNNAASDDYRLASTDTDAIGQGTDLSADATFAFDDDIAYTTRS